MWMWKTIPHIDVSSHKLKFTIWANHHGKPIKGAIYQFSAK